MSTEFNRIVACNVRYLRQRRGMLIEELAKLAYMALGTVSNIENANRIRDVDRNYVLQIAKALGVAPDVLTEENKEIQEKFRRIEMELKRQDYSEQTQVLIEEILTLTAERGPREKSKALQKSGELYYYRGMVKSAIGYFEDAAKYAVFSWDDEMLFDIRYNLISAYLVNKETSSASDLLNQIKGQDLDHEKRAKVLYLEGILLAHQKKYNLAIENLEQAIAKFSEPRIEVAFEGRCLQLLGEIYIQVKKFKDSLECLDRSVQICLKTCDTVGEVYSRLSLARAYIEQGNAIEARTHYLNVLDIAKSTKRFKKFILFKSEFGIALCDEDYDRMKELLNKNSNTDIAPKELVSMYRKTAKLAISRGHVHEAQGFYEKALNILEEC